MTDNNSFGLWTCRHGDREEASTNERLVGEITVLIIAEVVLALIMLRLEVRMVANPAGPFGQGYFYEPMFIGMLTLLSLLVRLASALRWCRWSHRIISVVRADGALTLRRATPKSMVWWFIPGFNLVMPYLVIREVWQAAIATFTPQTMHVDERPSAGVPMVLPIWWGF